MVMQNMERQMDPSRTRYLHLLDGGIADNLALRSMSNALIVLGRDSASMRYLAQRTRRIVVISVDGQAATNPRLGQQRVVGGIGQIFSAVSGAQIDAYGFETMLLASQQVDALTERIRKLRCEEAPVLDGHPCGDVRGGLVQISLSAIADPKLRARLQAIPTGLTIPDADVDALVSAGEALVQTNAQLRGLLGGAGGEAMAAAGSPSTN
jgi:NTE family protein